MLLEHFLAKNIEMKENQQKVIYNSVFIKQY